jgi:DNA-binding winged helix-turn-helix (wHTH) protein
MTKILCYEFEDFRLDPGKRTLLQSGELKHIRPLAFDMLLVLVQEHGKTLTKAEIIKHVWGLNRGDTGNFHVTLRAVREALGDSAQAAHYIIKESNGYRFASDVVEVRTSTDQTSHTDVIPINLPRDRNQGFTIFNRALRGRLLPVLSFCLLAIVSIVILIGRQRFRVVPQINTLALTSSAHPKQEFTVQIEGFGFDPDTVHAVLVGPGCKRFGPCTVPNDVLLDYGVVSKNKIERVPLTLDAGEFKLYIQNGKQGPPSNAWTLNVPNK